MKQELFHAMWLATSFLGLFIIAELLYRYGRVRVEVTRKTVHTGTGILTLLFPVYLGSCWTVLVLCSSFALILLLSIRRGFLPSINAIGRKSWGSITYPLSVYGCFCFYSNVRYEAQGLVFFYLPILILAICDPVAALCGRRWPMGKYRVRQETKTLMGSGCFFATAFAISLMLLALSEPLNDAPICVWLASMIIATTTTLAEARSSKGADNLFIPLAAALSLYAVIYYG